MKTPREKYNAFRKLYTGSDPHRQDHRRFDQLVRLLLDLPERDEPEIKVGDFVRHRPALSESISAFITFPPKSLAIYRVVAVEGDGATLRDENGRDTRRPIAELVIIPAFNGPIEEIPF